MANSSMACCRNGAYSTLRPGGCWASPGAAAAPSRQPGVRRRPAGCRRRTSVVVGRGRRVEVVVVGVVVVGVVVVGVVETTGSGGVAGADGLAGGRNPARPSVAGPAMPSAVRPLRRWNAMVAAAVSGPKMPSARPRRRPRRMRNRCQRRTSRPREPLRRTLMPAFLRGVGCQPRGKPSPCCAIRLRSTSDVPDEIVTERE